MAPKKKNKTIQGIPFHLINFIFHSKIHLSPFPPPPQKEYESILNPPHQHQTSNSHTGPSHRPIVSQSFRAQQFSHSYRSINTGQHINLPRPTPATAPFTKSVRFSRSRLLRCCRSERCNSWFSRHAMSNSCVWAWRSACNSASPSFSFSGVGRYNRQRSTRETSFMWRKRIRHL